MRLKQTKQIVSGLLRQIHSQSLLCLRGFFLLAPALRSRVVHLSLFDKKVFRRRFLKGRIIMKISTLLFLASAIAVFGCSRDRDVRQSTQSSAAVEPDNSGRNVRDRNDATKTPTDQSENEADRTITQNIRKALSDDDALSTNAKNVKIITSDGIVTLRGPVKSEKEKADIEAKAKQVAGVKRVDNQLEIAS
jgi:hypothetical protein